MELPKPFGTQIAPPQYALDTGLELQHLMFSLPGFGLALVQSFITILLLPHFRMELLILCHCIQ
jgi:hypothetical protein